MNVSLYILRCADGSYYTGSTTNLEARLAQHEMGEGSDYTARRLPVTLVFSCEFSSLHEAFLQERQIKGWSRRKKAALIRGDYEALIELSKSHSSQQHAGSTPPAHNDAGLNAILSPSKDADNRPPTFPQHSALRQAQDDPSASSG